MDIILWRHAEAADGSIDLERPLTAKGQRQAQKAAAELAARLPERYGLWVSQALRSRQTAGYLNTPNRTLPELNPDADPGRIVPLLEGIAENDTVVIVGHQPWIGSLCAFLLNQNRQHPGWAVKKGAFWWFRCHPCGGVFLSRLKLMMTPNEITINL